MKTKHFLTPAALVLCLFLPACSKQNPNAPAPENRIAAIRLFDIFEEEDLIGKVTLADLGWKRIEWRASEMTPWQPPSDTNSPNTKASAAQPQLLGFRPLNDLDELQHDTNGLQAKIKGPAPVLHFALAENRGGADALKFVEVRMKVSGAKKVWLRSQGEAAVDDPGLVRWATDTRNWNGSVDVVEAALHTYRFDVSSGDAAPGGRGGRGGRGGQGGGPGGGPRGGPPPGGGPPDARGGGPPPGGGQARRDLRHFSLTFRDCTNAVLSIESIRLVTDKEEKINEPSGQQWTGLSEVYRETLSAKTSETLRFPIRELPPQSWLDLAIGTTEAHPVTFTVSVSGRDDSADTAAAVVLERTVTIPNRWQSVRVDLAAHAGKGVILELGLKGEEKGLRGFWGAPVVRNSAAVADQKVSTTATGKKPRGVIFLVIDTLRKDHLNIYGYERETLIHLKKLAEKGVAFSHAISQGTMTKISQPSMVTSLYPMSHTVLGFDAGLPASADTIAEVFRAAGYATVCYSSVPFTGRSNNMHQGYEELHESGSISDNDFRSKTSRHYVDRLIQWLEEHEDVPFFAYLHVFDPHSPFRPRPPYDRIWAGPGDQDRMQKIEEDIRQHNVRTARDNMPHKDEYLKTGNDPDELLRIYKDWYDGSIRGVDAEVGRLIEALRAMGLDQDTLIVFSSDHGEELWDHGQFFHGQSVYGELNQVPLVFSWPNHPGIQKGAMVDRLVENVDIMPTILDLCGIEGPSRMQGRSLKPLLDGSGTSSWQPRVAVTQAMVGGGGGPGGGGGSAKPHFGVIEEGWKLVRKEIDPDRVEELYDHTADRLDQKNLIKADGNEARAATITKLFEGWKTRMETAKLPSDAEMAKELSSDELRRLQALGYVGGGVQARSETNRTTNAPPDDRNGRGP